MSAAARYRPSPNVLFTRAGDRLVLVHLRTDRIYELNRTGTRVWELLCAGRSAVEIRETMLQEFEVSEEELAREIDRLLSSLREAELIAAA